MNMGVPDAKI